MECNLVYICNQLVYIPHILPLYEMLGGDILTTNKEVYQAIPYPCTLTENIEQEIEKIQLTGFVDAIIVPNQIDLTKLNIPVIQVFHGVSHRNIKGYRPELYDKMLMCSPILYNKFIETYPNNSDKFIKTTFSRSRYYKQNTPMPTCPTVLYCPTHNLHQGANYQQKTNSINFLEQIITEVPKQFRLSIKLHPNLFRDGDAQKLQQQYPSIRFIIPSERRYFDYHTLFESASVLLGDMSSICYEFGLTGKNVVQLPDKNGNYDPLEGSFKVPLDNGKLRSLNSILKVAINDAGNIKNVYYKSNDIYLKIVQFLLEEKNR